MPKRGLPDPRDGEKKKLLWFPHNFLWVLNKIYIFIFFNFVSQIAVISYWFGYSKSIQESYYAALMCAKLGRILAKLKHTVSDFLFFPRRAIFFFSFSSFYLNKTYGYLIFERGKLNQPIKKFKKKKTYQKSKFCCAMRPCLKLYRTIFFFKNRSVTLFLNSGPDAL